MTDGSFNYFGEELRFAAEYPAFAYAEFCEAIEDGEDAASTRATGVALRLAVSCVAEGDRAKFRSLSREHNAKVEDWLKVYYTWTEAETERPTQQPTDSSDGLENTPESSESEPVASVTSLPPVKVAAKPRGDLALAASRSLTG